MQQADPQIKDFFNQLGISLEEKLRVESPEQTSILIQISCVVRLLIKLLVERLSHLYQTLI